MCFPHRQPRSNTDLETEMDETHPIRQFENANKHYREPLKLGSACYGLTGVDLRQTSSSLHHDCLPNRPT